ncbi:unnamed protein product, partial [Didymodactylos carnosus]
MTKRIVKRKQEYEDDTKNSRKLPPTGILALRRSTNSQEQQIPMKVSFSLSSVNSTVLNNFSSNLLSIPDESMLSRFVAARLDLPVSQRLLHKFRLSIIKRCYEDQLRLMLDDFVSDSDLYMACLILQKQIEVIDGKKENIIIPSKHLQEVTAKTRREAIIDQTHLTMEQDES